MQAWAASALPLSDRCTIMAPESGLNVDEHDKHPTRGDHTVLRNQFCQRRTERLARRVRNPDAAQLKKSCRGVILCKDHLLNRHEAGHDVALWFVELRPYNFRRGSQELISFPVGESAVRLDRQIGHEQLWPGSLG